MQRITEKPNCETESLDKLGLFCNKDLERKTTIAKQLQKILSCFQIYINDDSPYLEQLRITHLFSKTNPEAEAIIKAYLQSCDVNASNNLGMTLLHVLIWADRPDLASMVVTAPAFHKINFKFSLPFNSRFMYASALDLAIGHWLAKVSAINLEFIELLLKQGATPPKPNKKFLEGEFVSKIYPLMLPAKAYADRDNYRSPDEIKDMLCLLHRYGFSIQSMETELRRRLFDTQSDSNGRAAEFADVFGVSVEDQKVILDEFMQKLHVAVKNVLITKPSVEMTEERLDNGESTLRLPYDPSDRPCVVM